MSTSIKPPSTASSGPSGVPGLGEIKPTEANEAGVVRGATAPTSGNAAAGVEAPSAAWLRKLEAGEATRQQAIDGLVQQALEAHGGARLPAGKRVELEQVLREALLEDPVLRRLIGDG